MADTWYSGLSGLFGGGGFRPMSREGEMPPMGLGDQFANNAGLLIGLGAGIGAAPRGDPFQGVAASSLAGMKGDRERQYRMLLAQKMKDDQIYKRTQDAQQQSNWQKTFDRQQSQFE